jgi:hypothetical protein
MSRRIKEVYPVQREKLSGRAMTSKLMDAFVKSWPGTHPLLRLIKPLKDIPSTVRFEIALVSYESTSSFNRGESAGEYWPDTEPERKRESELAKRKMMLPNSPIYLILDTAATLPSELRKLGFKFYPKRLYLVSLLLPSSILGCIHSREHVIFDNFVTNKSDLNDDHRAGILSLGRYIRRTWAESQSMDLFMPVQSLLIIGHTDLVGDEDKNTSLGRRRAAAVKSSISRELPGHLRKSIALDSDGELTPLDRTEEEASSRNRRVEIHFSYHESQFEKLKTIEASILSLAEDDKGNPDLYKAVRCIGEAVTNLGIEDRYFIPVPPEKRHEANLHLRSRLLIQKYKNDSDKEIYKFLKEQIQVMYDAAWNATRHHRYSEHPNNIIRRAYIRRRIKNEVPSIWGCLTFG